VPRAPPTVFGVPARVRPSIARFMASCNPCWPRSPCWDTHLLGRPVQQVFTPADFRRRIVTPLTYTSHACWSLFRRDCLVLLRDRHWEGVTLTQPALGTDILITWPLLAGGLGSFAALDLATAAAFRERVLRRSNPRSSTSPPVGKRPVSGLRASLLVRVPGNQPWSWKSTKKVLAVPHLPRALEGLSLVASFRPAL